MIKKRLTVNKKGTGCLFLVAIPSVSPYLFHLVYYNYWNLTLHSTHCVSVLGNYQNCLRFLKVFATICFCYEKFDKHYHLWCSHCFSYCFTLLIICTVIRKKHFYWNSDRFVFLFLLSFRKNVISTGRVKGLYVISALLLIL